MTVSTLFSSENVLGESPFWHRERRSLFWVDIELGLLQELYWNTKQARVWDLGMRVSLILEEENDLMTLGVEGGIVRLNLQTGHVEWLADIEKDIAGRRCNDGAIDGMGRIWVGVMDVHCKEGVGSLYRLENSSAPPVRMIECLTIPNGLAWSHNGDRMYFIDTVSGGVKSYLFDVASGSIEFEKEAITVPASLGMPDGMTIDEEGMLWIALYGGFAVGRWNPLDGKLLELVKLSAPNITNCCFAGDDLSQLVVTSARENMSSEELAQYPESGNVFLIEYPGTRGHQRV
jgi:sugar lactone lactonase YvrE